MFRHAWASAYYVCWDEPQYEDGWFPSADEAIDSCTAHMGSMGYLAEPNLAYFLRVTLENAIRNVQAALGDLGVYFDEVKLAFDDWSYYHVGRPTCSFIVRITDRDSFVQNVIGRMLGHYQLYDDMQRNYDRFIHGQAGRGFLCAGASALILISVAAALDVGGTEGEFLSYAYQRLKDGKRGSLTTRSTLRRVWTAPPFPLPRHVDKLVLGENMRDTDDMPMTDTAPLSSWLPVMASCLVSILVVGSLLIAGMTRQALVASALAVVAGIAFIVHTYRGVRSD